MEPESEAPRGYRPDQVMGALAIASATFVALWGLVEDILRRQKETDLSRQYTEAFGTPIWLDVSSTLLNVAVAAIIGIGMVRGRGLAFLLFSLSRLGNLLYAISLFGGPRPIPPPSVGVSVFNLALFTYSGLRLFGAFGPPTSVPWLSRRSPLDEG